MFLVCFNKEWIVKPNFCVKHYPSNIKQKYNNKIKWKYENFIEVIFNIRIQTHNISMKILWLQEGWVFSLQSVY